MSSIETISVSHFMTRDVKTEKEDQNVLAACRIMHENNTGSIIIVKRDVVHVLGTLNQALLSVPLRDIMSTPLITISINSSIKDAIQTMQQKNIRRLEIVDKE
jgi:CBS domain-containing protein